MQPFSSNCDVGANVEVSRPTSGMIYGGDPMNEKNPYFGKEALPLLKSGSSLLEGRFDEEANQAEF